METLIRKLEGFGPLPQEDKDLLWRLAERQKPIGKNVEIIREGDSPSDVHLITSGLACRCKTIESGKRQIVAYLLPGDFCDLHVFILNAMDHNIRTLAPCTIVDIPRPTILRLLERPAVSRALLMATLADEGTLREWITNIGQRRAEERVAHFFCEMYARMKVVGLVDGSGIELPVTQEELADTVGLSTVHMNRSLQFLREKELIAFKSGKLYIPDVARLARMSDFRPNYLHLSDQEDRELVFDEHRT